MCAIYNHQFLTIHLRRIMNEYYLLCFNEEDFYLGGWGANFPGSLQSIEDGNIARLRNLFSLIMRGSCNILNNTSCLTATLHLSFVVMDRSWKKSFILSIRVQELQYRVLRDKCFHIISFNPKL